MNSKRAALIVAIVLLGVTWEFVWLLARPAHADRGNVFTVCPGGPPGCDFAVLQDAVDGADEGDLVKVAQGVYSDVHVRPRHDVGTTGVVTQVLYISKSVTIEGGYLAPGFSEPPDPGANPTILDAQGQGRVLYLTGDISPTIVGLRITGGNAGDMGGYVDPWTWLDVGGGIYCITAAVTLRESWVYSSTADFGGGLYLYQCNSAMLLDNAITHNSASQPNHGMGGGIHATACSDLLIRRNIVTANTASGNGGGGSLEQSHAVIDGNSIFGNNALNGGGLYLGGSEVQIDKNSILSNTATTGGGLYLHLGLRAATMTNNFVANNSAGSKGGGLYVVGSRAALVHNTIVHNSGYDGAGLHIVNGPKPPSSSSVALTNTILLSHTVAITVAEGNTATLNGTLWGADAWANDTDWGGTGVIITGTHNYWGDPAFARPETGDYHLRLTSEAIDKGIAASLAHDIDGDPRPDGCYADIGADEFISGKGCRCLYLPLVLRNR